MRALGDIHLPHVHLHLGLVPAESRQVVPMPSNLKNLVPQPTDDNLTLKKEVPDVEKDTLPLIVAKIKRTKWQSKKLAPVLMGSNLANTLRNDSDFMLKYIKYKKDDPEHEQLRSFRRMVWEGCGDCDCFTSIGGLLLNQGIKFAVRAATYDPKVAPKYVCSKDWSHVYIIVPKNQSKPSIANRADYIVIDPVTNKHDYEVPFIASIEKKEFMGLQYLDGPPSYSSSLNGLQYLDGLGCECGVPSQKSPGGPPKRSQVIGTKSLQERGIEPATNLLDKIALPYQKSYDPQGNVVYNVATPAGTKQVSGFLPISPADQEKVKSDLLAPANTSLTSSLVSGGNTTPTTITDQPIAIKKDFTPTQKKTAGIVLLAIAVAGIVIDSVRSKPKVSSGMGELPRKKIALYRM